jgi:hypothetical protein
MGCRPRGLIHIHKSGACCPLGEGTVSQIDEIFWETEQPV